MIGRSKLNSLLDCWFSWMLTCFELSWCKQEVTGCQSAWKPSLFCHPLTCLLYSIPYIYIYGILSLWWMLTFSYIRVAVLLKSAPVNLQLWHRILPSLFIYTRHVIQIVVNQRCFYLFYYLLPCCLPIWWLYFQSNSSSVKINIQVRLLRIRT